MATCTFRIGTADTGATPNTTAAFTPAAGEYLVVLAVCSGTVDTGPTCTSSVGGYTFTSSGAQTLWSGGGQSIYAFVGDAMTTAVSQTVTVDTPSDPSTGTVIFVYGVAGMHRTGTSGIRQVKTNFGVAATTPNAVFDAATLAGNPVLCVFANGANPAAITPPTSFTENAAGDIGYDTPTIGGEACARDSGHTSATVTWGSNSGTAWGVLNVELDATSTRTPAQGTAAFTGLAPTLAIDKLLAPGLGAMTLTGLAPTLGFMQPMAVGSLTVTGLAPVITNVITTGVGSIAVTGYATTMDKGIGPGLGSATFAGLAPVVAIGTGSPIIGIGVGSIAVSGLAPTLLRDVPRFPGVGAIAVTGLAPTIAVSAPQFIDVGTGSLSVTGLAPTATVTQLGGGGGPGLLLALGLNLEVSNVTAAPDAAALSFTTLAPSWGAGYTYSVPKGSGAFTGYAPSITTAEGPQVPVLPAPTQLTVTGLAPTVIHGRPVLFTFDADTQGFVGTSGGFTVMALAPATGNPPGGLSSRLQALNVAETNVWTLTTDWTGLGVPANQTITGIAQGSSESRVTAFTGTIVPVDVGAITLTPTGFSAITLAAGRTRLNVDTNWQTGVGTDTTGLHIPSSSSLTITAPNTLTTGPSGSPDVRLIQDNLGFTIIYEAAAVVDLPAGSIAATGYAPTVIGLAAEFGQPGAASLSIQGQGPTVQVVQGTGAGGGGPGLLLGIALNLEPKALGPAVLTITGYAPSIFHPITLGGSDDLISSNATMVASGVRIAAGPSLKQPGAGTLTLAGLAPTLVQTASRLFAMPVTALTFTQYLPTVGESRIVQPGVGAISITGLGVSYGTSELVSPGIVGLSITGLAPSILISATLTPAAGALAFTGLAPTLAFSHLIDVPAGALAFTGYDVSLIGAFTWHGIGDLASQRATLSATAKVIRHASGVLQSQEPLLFSGSGKHGHTATGTLQSGPASFHGPISAVDSVLQSGRATMKARARIIRFKPHHKPKPQRVNRYTVQLKPNKRTKVSKPNRRRPGK